MLNTREIAWAFWLTVFLIWALSKRTIRQSLYQVFRAALKPKLVTVFVFFVGYEIAVVYLLHKLGFWRTDLLKETIAWFFLSGLVTAFSMSQGPYDSMIVFELLRRSLGTLVLTEYIITEFTFGQLAELTLVPTLTILVMVDTYAAHVGEVEVARLTTKVLAISGFSILFIATGNAISNFQVNASLHMVRVYLTPAIFTIALIPFVYALQYYVILDDLFNRINRGLEHNMSVRRYAKWRIVLFIGFSVKRASTLLDEKGWELTRARTKADVDSVTIGYGLAEGSETLQ